MKNKINPAYTARLFKPLLWIAIPVFLSGCLEQEVTITKQPNKTMRCTDTRDGEVFIFETDSAHEAKSIGFNSASVHVVDNDGNIRELTKDMEAYIKCKEIKSH